MNKSALFLVVALIRRQPALVRFEVSAAAVDSLPYQLDGHGLSRISDARRSCFQESALRTFSHFKYEKVIIVH
jgi:hypothetical protein